MEITNWGSVREDRPSSLGLRRTTMYRAALIGCGGRASAHVEGYLHIENAEVVACCAPSPIRRDPLAAKYGIHAYDNPSVMIREEHPDIIHIITWPDTRVELMNLVSEHQVSLCTVEKPISIGTSDWRALTQLEKRTRTKFAVCHQFRWHPVMIQCQETLKSGKLGKPLMLDISSGMNIAGQGTHTLNYGRSLLGDPKVESVFANLHGWDDSDQGHPAPSSTVAQLTFDNGVRALWTSGSVSPRCGDASTVWQHVRVAAYAERGRVLYEEFGKWEIVSDGGAYGGNYGGMEEWRKNNILAQACFHKAMFRWLETGEAPGTNLHASLHEWATVLAIYHSAVEMRPVFLEHFDPPDNLMDRVRQG